MNRPFRQMSAFLIAGLLAAGCGLLPKEAEETPPPLIAPVKSVKEIYTVTRGDVAERVQLRAYLAPRHEAVTMFKIGGRLRKRYVEAGDSVREGQLLAELETGNLAAQAELARLNLERAQLRLRQAREKAETFKGGMDPYDEQYLQLDVKTAEINLGMLQAQLADARIYAPIAGVVSDAKGYPGEQLQPYQPVITVQDPNVLVIKADVEEAMALRITVGQRVQVQFSDWGDRLVEGKVIAVPSATDPAPPPGRYRQLQIEAEQPPSGARLGAVGRAFIYLQEKKNVLLVPNSAIRSYAGRRYVVVVEGDSRREVDVVPGIVGETDTEIVRGLSEGQKVMGR